MKSISCKILFLILWFSFSFTCFCQIGLQKVSPNLIEGSVLSNILKINDNDTSLFKLELKNCKYDANKNFIPYYVVSKTTDKNEIATPNLMIKKTRIVSVIEQALIKKWFSKYLKNEFVFEPQASVCKTENFNINRIIPFRLNNQNQIEELLDYELNWNTSNNPIIMGSKPSGNNSFNSVLASGDWFKIAITQSGVYKISREFLINMGMEVKNINPKNIHVYGNGGKMLPEMNKDFRYDDLQENAIMVYGEEDGKLDNLDYILFYATGTNSWVKNKSRGMKFSVTKNLYSDTSFYFVTVNSSSGKRIAKQSSSNLNPNTICSSYDYYNFHKEGLINFGKSGREFYGEYFDFIKSYNFVWRDGNFTVNDTLYAELSALGMNNDTTVFQLSGNNINFLAIAGKGDGGQYAAYGKPAYKYSYSLNPYANEINLNVAKITSKAVGYLDKITINARRNLIATGLQYNFRDTRSAGTNSVCQFNISNPNNINFSIWDVTESLNPKEQVYNSNNGVCSYINTSDSLKEYCLVSPSDYYTPSFVSKIQNQNIHSYTQADYLVITHPLFLSQAQKIAAFHNKQEGYTYHVVTTEQIYNEFSSGKQDAAAIRDFIRMLYSRNLSNGKQVKYVLLFGDGSYINKDRNVLTNSNFIPTYQSINSLNPTNSTATDDFYGLMDDNEGYYAEGKGAIDIGIGRFVCKNVDEANTIINKVFNYYKKDDNFQINPNNKNPYVANESTLGDWRNNLLFLADDEDNADHMSQSNDLTALISGLDLNYNYDKIFLDAYQRFSTGGGGRYPDAANDFIRQIKKGCLVFNYTGHGGEVGLTAERLIDIDIINSFNNFNKLPLFVTATCEFSRYDDPGRTSAGELCLLNSKGAAIALFTTCRVAYSGENFTLSKALMKELFTKNPDGSRPALGDVVQRTKAALTQDYNEANFHLLGDPALTLAYPKEKVFTTNINNNIINSKSSDTLSSLAKITIKGFVGDNSGNKLTNFNGIVYPTVYDKAQNMVCLMNLPTSALRNTDPPLPFSFPSQKNILYKGKVQATNGDFSFSFLVPKDISFTYGVGKISYYATNGNTDANGYYNKVIIGGASKQNIIDNDGPQVHLYMNEKSFTNGGITNENPVMFADVIDSSGINTVGTGLGHDIAAVLDAKSSAPIILNDYYEANLNSYQSGQVRYPFEKLSTGTHNLSFKIWDIQNNSSIASEDFIVAQSAELALQQVLNYPNPFTTHTQFMFQHNQTCVPLKVTVQIYTVSGKNIKTIQKDVTCDNDKPEAIEWDGKDDYGQRIGRGVYVYKLSIQNPENKKAEKIEKLVILN